MAHARTREPSSAPAAARRAAEAELRAVIARAAPAHAALVDAVRRALRRRLPGSHEVAYEYADSCVISYSPNARGYDGVVALRAGAKGVELCFNRGKDLPDPDKLLRGSGRQVRVLPVEAATTLARPAVARLLKEAVARSAEPFAGAGRGTVVVRPTAHAKRSARRAN